MRRQSRRSALSYLQLARVFFVCPLSQLALASYHGWNPNFFVADNTGFRNCCDCLQQRTSLVVRYASLRPIIRLECGWPVERPRGGGQQLTIRPVATTFSFSMMATRGLPY